MYQETAKVLWNRQIGPSYYKIGMSCQPGYAQATPGQFIMLRLSDQMDPLLRRPFSIHRLITQKGSIAGLELLYKVVGAATAKMALAKPGDSVDLLGPLGSGFSMPDNVQRPFIVAGGIGVAPMYFLVTRLLENHVAVSNCKLFLGGRSKDDLLCRQDFSELGVSVHLTTDDGSWGDQCLVTHPVDTRIEALRPDIIYACGPMDMLICVSGIAETHRIPCQVSIETMMACGVGACLGCAVAGRKQPDRYLHACLDGPVFDINDLDI